MRGLISVALAGLLGVNAIASGPSSTIPSSQATAFIGTWKFAMTEPANSEETIAISDKNGVLAASVQIGRFPANEVTGILKDGDVLLLTTTLRENGQPIWAVIALTLEGDTMSLAQMLQRSQTIKRGTAHKQTG